MFKPVDKTRAFEAVVTQIESAIYSGEYRPGDFLPPERTLVENFGVGRSTVREALRILESMGLVRTSPGSRSGPQVDATMTPGLTRMLRGAVRMEQIPVVELVQYRIIAGAAANRLAAHLRTEEHLTRMAEAIDAMASAKNTAAFAAADDGFHAVIREAAGNRLLGIIGGVIQDATLDLVAGAVSPSAGGRKAREKFIAVHRDVLAAIENRDGDTAARLAGQTLYAGYAGSLDAEQRTRLRVLLGPDGAPELPGD
ncbi:FadR family transcriptional regulator [Amycolatopsis acidicola]|uniref:FadR family transcriptional regulator n=1 Tax=Amycolatopsis acidicola TaxID=2596893 RepID=A0A5N0VLM6_9PSEU|nr:GntR family transcriptional regulator [Amycolatopsis acidicola]KAA9166443.1 FadR family transcriptional regulator [Amycolatopsis acidicola]